MCAAELPSNLCTQMAMLRDWSRYQHLFSLPIPYVTTLFYFYLLKKSLNIYKLFKIVVFYFANYKKILWNLVFIVNIGIKQLWQSLVWLHVNKICLILARSQTCATLLAQTCFVQWIRVLFHYLSRQVKPTLATENKGFFFCRTVVVQIRRQLRATGPNQ